MLLVWLLVLRQELIEFDYFIPFRVFVVKLRNWKSSNVKQTSHQLVQQQQRKNPDMTNEILNYELKKISYFIHIDFLETESSILWESQLQSEHEFIYSAMFALCPFRHERVHLMATVLIVSFVSVILWCWARCRCLTKCFSS